MATTTPNYGWTVPTSTDLVKDGATAIETLGDAIDASLNTALGTKKAGMVLLNTTSFSAVASQSINDVFSATYKNYRIGIVLSAWSGTDDFLRMRLRVGGADNTSSVYNTAGDTVNSAGTRAVMGSGSDTFFYVQELDGATTGYYYSTSMDIYSPQLAFATTATHLSMGFSRAGQPQATYCGLMHNAGTSFTGFTIYPGNGTISGTVRIYGYNE